MTAKPYNYNTPKFDTRNIEESILRRRVLVVISLSFFIGLVHSACGASFLDDFSVDSSAEYIATDVLIANNASSFEGEAVYDISGGLLSITNPTAVSSSNRPSLQSTFIRSSSTFLDVGERLILDLPTLTSGTFGSSDLASLGVVVAKEIVPGGIGSESRDNLLYSSVRQNNTFVSMGFDEFGANIGGDFNTDLPVSMADVQSIYIERVDSSMGATNDYTFHSGIIDNLGDSYILRSNYELPALTGNLRVGLYTDIRSNQFVQSVDNLRIESAPGLTPTEQILGVQEQWDVFGNYGEEGHVGVRAFVDIDNDGQNEVIFNLGRSADFVALEMDGTEIWRRSIETSNSKIGYYQKISLEEGLLFYPSRATNTVHAVEIATGNIAWSRKVSGQGNVSQLSLELADVGVIAGHSGSGSQTVLFDFQGNILPGWPYAGPQHEQLLGAGDLDGDGEDEFIKNNNNGNFAIRNRDGSLLFTRDSFHTHLDYSIIADINQDGSNPNNIGAELLVALDDDNSHSGEGDEIVMLNALGNEVARYETGSAGVNFAVGDVRPDLPGLEVFFGNEGSNTIGLLDHKLNPIFTKSLAPTAAELGISLDNAAGQTSLADLDGDGILELLINSGENSSAGILAFDANGNLFDAIIGYGWDFDPLPFYSSADPRSKQFFDVNGDGLDDIIASSVGANSSSGDRMMYLLGNIVAQTGDLNADGYVDGLDLGILLGSWSQVVPSELGELDGSPPVDGLDLGILLGAWNPPPQVATVVPEASTCFLLAIAGVILLQGKWPKRLSY